MNELSEVIHNVRYAVDAGEYYEEWLEKANRLVPRGLHVLVVDKKLVVIVGAEFVRDWFSKKRDRRIDATCLPFELVANADLVLAEATGPDDLAWAGQFYTVLKSREPNMVNRVFAGPLYDTQTVPVYFRVR